MPWGHEDVEIRLGALHVPKSEVHDLLESMVRANPTRETVLKAAKTLEFVGDAEGANAWRRRAPPPPGAQRTSPRASATLAGAAPMNLVSACLPRKRRGHAI
jgi:hypothetical protein